MTTDPAALFVELSEALTGVPGLSPALAAAYAKRVRAAAAGDRLDRLLDRFREAREAGQSAEEAAGRLLADPEFRPAAHQVIVLWYTSALMDDPADPKTGLTFGTPDQHFQALVWTVIGAHPPALSGGYFGHWHYPPEN